MEQTAIRAILVVIGCCGTIGAGEPRSVQEAVGWLQGHARTMIRASRRPMKDGVAAFLPQAGGGYDAFWLRDYAYMVEGSADAFSNKELTDACMVFVNGQRADGACVDCVRLDGTPIYKPGGGTMGENPVADGSQFTVAVAWHTYRRVHDRAFLEPIVGRLLKAMEAVPRNPATGLVHIRPGGYDRCPYGFTDTVREQGDVLFCSLLQVEASRRLADLLAAVRRRRTPRNGDSQADRLAATIRTVFWDQSLGLFHAATVRCKEPNIWAPPSPSIWAWRPGNSRWPSPAISSGITASLSSGASAPPARRKVLASRGPKDEYRNGGFWATPTGWFVYTLDLVDPPLADQTVLDIVSDFRQRGIMEMGFGAKKGSARLCRQCGAARSPAH